MTTVSPGTLNPWELPRALTVNQEQMRENSGSPQRVELPQQITVLSVSGKASCLGDSVLLRHGGGRAAGVIEEQHLRVFCGLHMHACTSVRAHIHTHICLHTCMHTCIHTCVYTHGFTHMHTHACTHICILTYTYTHMHAHI